MNVTMIRSLLLTCLVKVCIFCLILSPAFIWFSLPNAWIKNQAEKTSKFFNSLKIESSVFDAESCPEVPTLDTTLFNVSLKLSPGIPEISIRNSVAMERQIQKMLCEVRKIYQAKMKRLIDCQLSGKCPVQLERCKCEQLDAYCGGLGDRLFGLSLKFYYAFAFDHILIVDITKPVPMAEFFDFNDALYGIKNIDNQIQQLIKNETKNSRKQPPFESIFSEQTTQAKLSELMATIQRYYIDPVTLKPMPLHYELLFFVALNVVLSKPKNNLKDAINVNFKEIDDLGEPTSQKCHIGIHIRTNPSGMYKRKNLDYPRLSRKQLQTCYFNKVVNVSRNCPKTPTGEQPTPVVYIASDSEQAKTWMMQELQKIGIKSLGSNYKAVQIDIDFTNSSMEYRRQALLSTLIDWMMLAKMNELVIPRSGYSEFASTFGSLFSYRRPTHRLALTFSENCSFQYDYYRKFAKLESNHPMGKFEQGEFND